MTESKPGGRVGVKAGEVLFEALPDGIEGFKTRRPFGGVNADTIGRAVIDGGEYSDRTIVEGHRAVASMPHIWFGRSVVMVPVCALRATGAAWRWGARS